MWSLIAALISAVVGFGAGSTGLGQFIPNQSTPIQTTQFQACYQPQPDIQVHLTWPDNFTNVPDYRKTLNPAVFGNVPDTFSSTPDSDTMCQSLVMGPVPTTNDLRTTRDYILVRQDVRIASCKTDEMAGPYGSGHCPDWRGQSAIAIHHRGTCALDGYTDLRKIAQVGNQEIFWNPFSYNVGCSYQQGNNCGPGANRQSNINLKDFIYVLKKRDAFDVQSNPSCPVLWDAGSTNELACSHYFDVYMAKDLYEILQTIDAAQNPDSPYYFLKQVVENCKEQVTFMPAPEANLSMPPIFISLPFSYQTGPAPAGTIGKIVSNNTLEQTNYTFYIWNNALTIKPGQTSLLKTTEVPNVVTLCGPRPTYPPEPTALPTLAPQPNCYDPIGTLALKDDTGNVTNFNVYSQPSAQQTFTLVRTDNPAPLYVYAISDQGYPTNDRRDPSLQLHNMQIITQNEWTWATPWCKPAIYLYPQKPTDVNVKLQLDGKMTVSAPEYDATNGWNVHADPNGKLTQLTTYNSQPTTSYPYLYYEADLKNVDLPKEGWVVEKSKLKDQISKILGDVGFNEKETADFLKYWLPRLTEKPYYFVTLLPENVINAKEKLTLSQPTTNNSQPTTIVPDTLIRARVVFEALDAPISVSPLPSIPSHIRSGFVVTDWGGTLVGRSCDVTVK